MWAERVCVCVYVMVSNLQIQQQDQDMVHMETQKSIEPTEKMQTRVHEIYFEKKYKKCCFSSHKGGTKSTSTYVLDMQPCIWAGLPGLQATSKNTTSNLKMCQLFFIFPAPTQLLTPYAYRGPQGEAPRCKCMSGGQSLPIWTWLCQWRPWRSALMTVMDATWQNHVVFVRSWERGKINSWFGEGLSAAFK